MQEAERLMRAAVRLREVEEAIVIIDPSCVVLRDKE